MIKEKEDVCVLIVTYNRKEYLLKLIGALKKQNYPIKKILIFDNFSNDGTPEILKEHGYIDSIEIKKINSKKVDNIEFNFYRNDKNTGGSGGFSEGMKIAKKFNTKYIWMMDDDVLPHEDCLEKLVKNMSKNRKMCIPNRTCEIYQDFVTTSINMKNILKKERERYDINEIENKVTDIAIVPFEGPLVDTELIDQIGYPNGNLFIFYDDTDYSYRAQKVTKIGFIKDAILERQINFADNTSKKLNWRDYYMMRNGYWFDNQHGENFIIKKVKPLFIFLVAYIKNILKLEFKNAKIVRYAYMDAIKNRLGKTVEPGKEFKRNIEK